MSAKAQYEQQPIVRYLHSSARWAHDLATLALYQRSGQGEHDDAGRYRQGLTIADYQARLAVAEMQRPINRD